MSKNVTTRWFETSKESNSLQMQLITGRVTGQQPVDNRFKVYARGVLQLLFSGQSSSQSFRLPRGQRFLAVNKSIDENNPLHSIDYDFQRISPGIA